MNPAFKSLNESEYNLLIEAIPLIAILIAGADGEINLKEKEWAEKITKIRTYASEFELKPLYKDIDAQFKIIYDKLIAQLDENHDKRNAQISNKLSGLNEVFLKLNMRTAGQLYNGYISFAEQVARASGGFMRMMSVSREESMWTGLPMIDPIFFDDFDEEE